MPSARQGPAHSLRREGSQVTGSAGGDGTRSASDCGSISIFEFFLPRRSDELPRQPVLDATGLRIVNFLPRKSAFFHFIFVLSPRDLQPWTGETKCGMRHGDNVFWQVGSELALRIRAPSERTGKAVTRGPSRFQPSDRMKDVGGPETLRSRPPKKSCEERGEGAEQETRTRTPKKKIFIP